MRIVLASKSPRRQEIISKYIKDFIIVESSVEEAMDDLLDPAALAMSLAYQKAADVQQQVEEDDLVIAADTIVVTPSTVGEKGQKKRILGKPKDRADAKNMIQSLAGKTHMVLTGIALLQGEIKVVDHQCTWVSFSAMNEAEVEAYLDAGDYGDKAGAYGIQGYAEPFIQSIRGSYSNVVGLPVERLYPLLKNHFNVNLMKGTMAAHEDK
jgi:septum formation protein